jgi:hypothetical protein
MIMRKQAHEIALTPKALRHLQETLPIPLVKHPALPPLEEGQSLLKPFYAIRRCLVTPMTLINPRLERRRRMLEPLHLMRMRKRAGVIQKLQLRHNLKRKKRMKRNQLRKKMIWMRRLDANSL